MRLAPPIGRPDGVCHAADFRCVLVWAAALLIAIALPALRAKR
jgi:hypothetical protein